MFDEITEISLLYDFYGELLTERRKEVMRLYHEENYTLSEIADELGISRQGVHDALKTAERTLAEYEAKLGLVERFAESRNAVTDIKKRMEKIAAAHPELADEISGIEQSIEKLEF